MACVEVSTRDEFCAAVARGDCIHVRSGEFEATGTATVRAYDWATVHAYGSATVRAYGTATVRAYGSATVHATGSTTVHAYAMAVVLALAATVTVRAAGMASVIRDAPCSMVSVGAMVSVTDRMISGLAPWAAAYGCERAPDGRLRLYKWVGCDGYSSHGFRYVVGSVEAPDWDADGARDCGGGLHACASLRDALGYHGSVGHAVEILVADEDVRSPRPTDNYPDKLRFRRGEVVRFWKPTAAEVWES